VDQSQATILVEKGAAFKCPTAFPAQETRPPLTHARGSGRGTLKAQRSAIGLHLAGLSRIQEAYGGMLLHLPCNLPLSQRLQGPSDVFQVRAVWAHRCRSRAAEEAGERATPTTACDPSPNHPATTATPPDHQPSPTAASFTDLGDGEDGRPKHKA
jgi:hypothetical protein